MSILELKKRPGTTNSGQGFEAKLSALFTINCLFNENIKNFWCLNNANDVGGDLDDFVLSTEDFNDKKQFYFVQLKHHDKNVPLSYLLKENDDFSIRKYARSYEVIKQSYGKDTLQDASIKNSIFILYTNAKFNFQSQLNGLNCKAATGPDLFVTKQNGAQFQFESGDFDSNFLENFYFYTNEARESTLQGLMKLKLCDRFGNIDDSVVSGIIDYFTSWVKADKVLQLTKRYIEEKLLELLLLQYVSLPVSAPVEMDNEINDLIMETFLNFKDSIIPYHYKLSTGYLWSSINRTIRAAYGDEINLFSWNSMLSQTLKNELYASETMKKLLITKLSPQCLTVKHLMVAMWEERRVPLIVTYNESTKPIIDETVEIFKHLLKEKSVILLIIDARYPDINRHNMTLIDRNLLDHNLNKMTLSLQGKNRINLVDLKLSDDVLQCITPSVYVKFITGNFQIGQPSSKPDTKVLNIISPMLDKKIFKDINFDLIFLCDISSEIVHQRDAAKPTHVVKLEFGRKLLEWIHSEGPINDIRKYIVDDTEPRKMRTFYNNEDDSIRERVKIFSTSLQKDKQKVSFGDCWSPEEWIINIDLDDRNHKDHFKRNSSNNANCIDYFMNCTIKGADDEELCRRMFDFFVRKRKMIWIVHNFHQIEKFKYSLTIKNKLKEAVEKGVKLVIVVPAKQIRQDLEEFFNVFTTKITEQKINEGQLLIEQRWHFLFYLVCIVICIIIAVYKYTERTS